MAKISLSLFLLCCILGLVSCYATNSQPIDVKQAGLYCVANTNGNPPYEKFQGFIDYACGILDCSPIRIGGSCYFPNILVKHTTWVLNLFYKSRGVCNTEIGLITSVNPSYPGCTFPTL
ncbi:hypothetical protein ABFS82_14G079400 [Erythranthe guttata]